MNYLYSFVIFQDGELFTNLCDRSSASLYGPSLFLLLREKTSEIASWAHDVKNQCQDQSPDAMLDSLSIQYSLIGASYLRLAPVVLQ
jgi:hypothetical protein